MASVNTIPFSPCGVALGVETGVRGPELKQKGDPRQAEKAAFLAVSQSCEYVDARWLGCFIDELLQALKFFWGTQHGTLNPMDSDHGTEQTRLYLASPETCFLTFPVLGAAALSHQLQVL